MKILLTAFDPFGGEQINPASLAVQQIPDSVSGAQIVKITVPTVFGKALSVLWEAIEREQPDAILSIGQAGGRSDLTVERIAINMDDARIPDNEGNRPVDRPIFPDGPAAYFSTLPVRQMVEAIRACGIPASISNTAGTFVCNHLLYGTLHTLREKGNLARAGFLHVPFLPSQVTHDRQAPSMELAHMVRGIEAALSVIANT